ncbi:myotubularin-related protein 14 [Lasius niger]|uniref:Myotubularin-related protein 14 n=1 Tax=Lasius niger TaxID=67767 RepID=A0A0J7KJC9_LASNI|nr:myotubularin-related protein 14 [Lasius niger]
MSENIYIRNKLKKLMKNSRFARCRSRFPIPVILYKGRHVCRSATLASSPEMFGRAGLDFILSSLASTSISSTSPIPLVDKSLTQVADVMEDSRFIDMKNKFRLHDIELLKTLNVGTIIDFMVEKKKVKYGMT